VKTGRALLRGLRQTHDTAHARKGAKNRFAILRLLRVPAVQGNFTDVRLQSRFKHSALSVAIV